MNWYQKLNIRSNIFFFMYEHFLYKGWIKKVYNYKISSMT
jgi:hypothetical protein